MGLARASLPVPAVPSFLELSRAGKLERDVWLLHLTGEEFPSDCLGARHFCQALIEKTLALRVQGDGSVDLSTVTMAGVYVMDMIAHNRDDALDIFQISPGAGAAALRLAYHAHIANTLWNDKTRELTLSLMEGSKLLAPSPRSFEVRVMGSDMRQPVKFDGTAKTVKL